MNKLRDLVAISVALVAASPASAGTVFVPFAADLVVDGIHYETQVWATNRSAGASRSLSTVFIPAGSDGTDRAGAAAHRVDVPANASLLLRGLAPNNAAGLLEISGAPQVSLSAQVLPTGNNLGRSGTELPTISNLNALPANSTNLIQGLARGNQLKSDFVLVNLGSQGASCTVTATAANGTNLAPPARLSLPPLSMQRYTDALGILGQQAVSGARINFTCNQPHYGFAIKFDGSHAAVSVHQPAATLASTLGPNPPPPPPPPAGCPQGALCFDRLSTPFVATRGGETYHRETLPTPDGEYRKLRLRITLVTTTEVAAPVSGLHMFFWLAIQRNLKLLAFTAFRGTNEVLFRHGVDVLAPFKEKIVEPFTFVPGRTYKADYLYDAANHRLELKILDAADALLLRIVDDTNVDRIRVAPQEDLVVDVSFRAGVNDNEPPSYGWQYKDLHVELYP